MSGALERLLGPAVRSREGCDWWQVARNDGRRRAHICLSSPPASNVAHVLIFDPDAEDNEYIIDVSARSEAEIEEVVTHIKEFIDDAKPQWGRILHRGDQD